MDDKVKEALDAIVARLDKLEKAAADKAKAESDGAADAEVKAALGKLDGRLVAGTMDAVKASLEKLDSPAVKLAVLATLDATLPAGVTINKEKLAAAAPVAQVQADPGEVYINAVMERDKIARPEAVVRACVEKPELYAPKADPAEEGK